MDRWPIRIYAVGQSARTGGWLAGTEVGAVLPQPLCHLRAKSEVFISENSNMARYRKRGASSRRKGARTYRRKMRKMRGRGRRPRRITNVLQPAKGFVKMKYSTTFTLDPATGTTDYRHFSCNSIYDPDRNLGGHQPYLSDMYETLYTHYEVLRSTIVVRPVLTSATPAAVAAQVALSKVSNTTDGIKGYDDLRESCRGTVRYLNTNSGVPKLKSTWSRRKWIGANSPQEFGADFGSDPTKQAFFRIQYSPMYNTEDLAGTQFAVDIYYTVRLTGPITQAKSS